MRKAPPGCGEPPPVGDPTALSVPIRFLVISTAAASIAIASATIATWNCLLSRCRETWCEECTTRR